MNIIKFAKLFDKKLFVLKDMFFGSKGFYNLKYKNDKIFILRGKNNDVADIDILYEIFGEDVYGELDEHIKGDEIVLDVGANIGFFALKFADKLSDGKIYCLEPMKENFDFLLKNISINKKTNIESINMALTSVDGKKDFYQNAVNNGGHTVFDLCKGKKIEVEGISLKSFMNKFGLEKIDILKLDCEGSEFDLLFNMERELFDKIGMIFMEVHFFDQIEIKYSIQDVYDLLISNGFDVKELKNIYYKNEGRFYNIFAKKDFKYINK